jgi:glycosyltransferase involved in cell wall biosynthesis
METSPADIGIEFIVVDNNSTDNTYEAIRALLTSSDVDQVKAVPWNRFFPGRIFKEERQGLSHARNRGWREARGEYVGYLDDDALADPQWLAVAREIIETQRPAMFGGPYYPFYDSPKPIWFKDDYGSRSLGDEARSLRADEYLSGGNMFYRRDVLEELGGFDADFGMSGDRIRYGEESQLQALSRSLHPEWTIYYDPRLSIRHLVRADKMTLRWRLRQSLIQGRDIERVLIIERDPRSLGKALCDLALAMFWLSYDAIVKIHRRNRRVFPHWQQFFYEQICMRTRILSGCWTALAERGKDQ